MNETMRPQTLNEYLFDCIVNDATVWGWLCDHYQSCTPQPFYDTLKTALQKYRRAAKTCGDFPEFSHTDQEQRWMPLIFELTRRLEEITTPREEPVKITLLERSTEGMDSEERQRWWDSCKLFGVSYLEVWSSVNKLWEVSSFYPQSRPGTGDTYRIPAEFWKVKGDNTNTQPETTNEGELPMKTFKIENRIYINGLNTDDLNDDELLGYVTSAESEMERLARIKTTSAKVKDRIEKLEKFCVDMVAIIDAR